MEENDANGIPKEEPTGNLVIQLNDIESFEGSIDISNAEALVDEAFMGFHTISIEGQEKKYHIEERQELLDEINKLLRKENENEKNI